ncbi:MAG: VCBS repeat-containing protein [Deltaproteobacteria bacterium]|nr:VCBS repeat-containing protein [Deltaproteobacteria bacterium]
MSRRIYFVTLLLAGVFLIMAAGPSVAWARLTIRVSVAGDGSQANALSEFPGISADGRYVFFHSDATNLVTGDTNNASDIFRHDLVTGETIRVSVAHDGSEANSNSSHCAVSLDGRTCAFQSWASNLLASLDDNGAMDIFVRDITGGSTTRASLDAAGSDPNQSSKSPGISADGRYVNFSSESTDMISGGTNGQEHVYLHDRVTGQTVLVSRNSSGAEGDGPSFFDRNSAASWGGGRYVCFSSTATNLVDNDDNGTCDIFVRDLQAGTTTRVSVAPDGSQADGSSSAGLVTPDGAYLIFQSGAANLVVGDTNGFDDIFRKDLATGAVIRVSLAPGGAEADGDASFASIRSDGGLVAFQSLATNLVAGDTNSLSDVFVSNPTTGATFRANLSSLGNEANGFSGFARLAAEATHVAFLSDASNLVPGDTNGVRDIFVNGPFLEDAVDLAAGELANGGDAAWRPSRTVFHADGDAAQSGAIAADQTSDMSLTVSGPGVLAFWWKVSSEVGGDYLEFLVDGVLQERISGEVAWTAQVSSLAAGEHVLVWRYAKNAAGEAGADAGWVDAVEFGTSTRRTMYRAYNEALMYHFFTTRAAEFQNAVAAGYQDESGNPAKLFYMSAEQAPGAVPLHRLYNPNAGRHYYTKSNSERDSLVTLGWNFERDEGNLFTSAAVAPADATEVFHLYHPVIGTHLYTKNAGEAAWVVANLPPWVQHTSLGWAYNSLTVGGRYAGEAGKVSPDSDLLRDAARQAGVDLARLPAWRALARATAAITAGSGAGDGVGLGITANSASRAAATAEAATGEGSRAWRDFDGDGADDLVEADPATGRVSLALMGPAGPRETVDLGVVADRAWGIRDVADLDGDGGPDLLWWNPATREVSFWLLSGTVVAARPVVARLPGGSTLAGAGDYDGDGRVEVAWRDAAGRVYFTPLRP